MRKFIKYEEIIELLSDDCEIYTHWDEINHSQIWEVSNCKNINRFIHHSTISKLKRNKIILKNKPYTFLLTK